MSSERPEAGGESSTVADAPELETPAAPRPAPAFRRIANRRPPEPAAGVAGDAAAGDAPAEATVLEPDAPEPTAPEPPAREAPTPAAVSPGAPSPAGVEPASEPDVPSVLLPEIGPDSLVLHRADAADRTPAAPPPPAPVTAAPPPAASRVAAPPSAPSPDRSSAASAEPRRPSEVVHRDLQAELDAAVGCGEWFDRRPVPAPPPPPTRPLVPEPPLYSVTAGEPALATALPSFDPPPVYEPFRPVRTARPEFGGGDIGAGPDRIAALLGYLLLIVGAPTVGVGLVLGLALAWNQAKTVEDWRRTHYLFQVRTALIGLTVGLVCGVAVFVDYVTYLATPVLVLMTGWVVLRAALGLDHLFQGRPHPNYRTWFV